MGKWVKYAEISGRPALAPASAKAGDIVIGGTGEILNGSPPISDLTNEK